MSYHQSDSQIWNLQILGVLKLSRCQTKTASWATWVLGRELSAFGKWGLWKHFSRFFTFHRSHPIGLPSLKDLRNSITCSRRKTDCPLHKLHRQWPGHHSFHHRKPLQGSSPQKRFHENKRSVHGCQAHKIQLSQHGSSSSPCVWCCHFSPLYPLRTFPKHWNGNSGCLKQLTIQPARNTGTTQPHHDPSSLSNATRVAAMSAQTLDTRLSHGCHIGLELGQMQYFQPAG